MASYKEKSNDSSNYYRGVTKEKMNTIEEKTKALLWEIKNSKEYLYYRELQEQLEENEELLKKVNEYRREAFNLHNGPDVGNVMNEVREIRERYKEELSDPIVRSYLIAEQNICRMVREISNAIAEELELDYEFLE